MDSRRDRVHGQRGGLVVEEIGVEGHYSTTSGLVQQRETEGIGKQKAKELKNEGAINNRELHLLKIEN